MASFGKRLVRVAAREPFAQSSTGGRADWKTLFTATIAGAMVVAGLVAAINFRAVKTYALRPLAAFGDAASQNNLGAAYSKGWGVAKNDTTAAQWFQLAADQGNPDAQFNMGLLFLSGLGVSKDLSKAVTYFRLAADHGHAGAQSNLGSMYQDGAGVGKDFSSAVVWYRKAAEQGLAVGQYNLGAMYENGFGVKKNNTEAQIWYGKAAQQGLMEAQKKLEVGMSPENPQDILNEFLRQDTETLPEALRKLRELGGKGDITAQQNLGTFYLQGIGVPKDLEEASKWYQLAAEQGSGTAQFNLAAMYAMGAGVGMDKVQAYKWFSLAMMNKSGAAGQSRGAAALESRNRLASTMQPGQIAEAERRAKEWRPNSVVRP